MIKKEKFIKVIESKGIDISDVRKHWDHCLFEENPEEIHLLLAADTAACLFTERIEHFLGHEIAAFETKDNVVRLAKVKTDNGIFLRPIQRLFPLEISQSEDDPLPGGDVLHKQVFQKQSAYPAAGLERPSQDAASSNVPRTERVIKPPQRLDL
ncbi:hypothetical protein NPIL_323281 [Nephila pilipes]|uniref:Uncharacterized protein n=1 Tax=Nephila pilipes TaxID=299642 RepID=A0A8X6UCM7_NEPPI|nr:hypothetical protein NPIL_323281 [Nephila pilipes]